MDSNARIDRLLRLMSERGASDLHLQSGAVPQLRVDGALEAMPLLAPSTEEWVRLFKPLAGSERWEGFLSQGELLFAYTAADLGRFRISLLMRHGGYGAVIRSSPNRPIPVAALGLPACFHQICSLEGGLVVVAGPRSSGRSTTIAAFVHELAHEQRRRVATIEHPIETVYEEHGRVSQRSLEGGGAPVDAVVRATLREQPDVLIIDAPSDPGSIPAAMRAGGPLVLLVIDATDGEDVLCRLIEARADQAEHEGRQRLSVLLRAIFVQRLIPSTSGGRIAAIAALLATAESARLLREGDAREIASSMSSGDQGGSHSLDDALYALAVSGEISVEDAALAASSPAALRERLQSTMS